MVYVCLVIFNTVKVCKTSLILLSPASDMLLVFFPPSLGVNEIATSYITRKLVQPSSKKEPGCAIIRNIIQTFSVFIIVHGFILGYMIHFLSE